MPLLCSCLCEKGKTTYPRLFKNAKTIYSYNLTFAPYVLACVKIRGALFVIFFIVVARHIHLAAAAAAGERWHDFLALSFDRHTFQYVVTASNYR